MIQTFRLNMSLDGVKHWNLMKSLFRSLHL